MLASYALAVAGQARRAATMMLRAGGGRNLHPLQSVDRACGYELLVTAALGEGDTEAAQAWAALAARAPLGADSMATAATAHIRALAASP